MPSVPNQLKTPGIFDIVAEPPGLHWTWGDSTADGQVAFNASVDLAGRILSEANKVAFCRAACIFFAAKLNDTAILEAYESLHDLYRWQIEKGRYIAKAKPSLTTISISNIHQLPRNPFVVDPEII